MNYSELENMFEKHGSYFEKKLFERFKDSKNTKALHKLLNVLKQNMHSKLS